MERGRRAIGVGAAGESFAAVHAGEVPAAVTARAARHDGQMQRTRPQLGQTGTYGAMGLTVPCGTQ
ncbi:hypothetical protein DVA86_21905 [Streptomyces armeniacus]|uniref:Uncharacterized protein n=1 Tax=Streptomyces armeniacus TaxID=83291 RepID=A0A345XTD9_9ACTN|nr:hypothetical protein DVA86_21905 [Streptomyces armeniacus]